MPTERKLSSLKSGLAGPCLTRNESILSFVPDGWPITSSVRYHALALSLRVGGGTILPTRRRRGRGTPAPAALDRLITDDRHGGEAQRSMRHGGDAQRSVRHGGEAQRSMR